MLQYSSILLTNCTYSKLLAICWSIHAKDFTLYTYIYYMWHAGSHTIYYILCYCIAFTVYHCIEYISYYYSSWLLMQYELDKKMQYIVWACLHCTMWGVYPSLWNEEYHNQQRYGLKMYNLCIIRANWLYLYNENV